MERIKDKRLMGIIHASIWLILFVFMFGAAVNIYKPIIAFFHSFSNIILVMLLFYAHVFLINTYLEKKKYGQFILFSALIFFAIFMCRMFINMQIMQLPNTKPFQNIVKPPFRIGLLVFLTSGFIWLLAIAYQLLVNRFEKEQHNLKMLNEQQKAQFQYLKAQINPHFLFNALNNIYSLTVVKSNDAPKMLLQLSDLLRYAIYDGQQELVPLEKELTYIQKFIDLFQLKSEHLLNISFTKEGNTEGVCIEPMILIPLVENCFKHSDVGQNSEGFIHIIFTKENNGFSFFTRNTFDKDNRQKDNLGGVGLDNIQRRLALRYGTDFSLKADEGDAVFTVNLKINDLKKDEKLKNTFGG